MKPGIYTNYYIQLKTNHRCVRRIFFLFIVTILSINTYAQTSTIYVVFTKTPSGTGISGIRHSIISDADITTMFRSAIHNYRIANVQASFYSSFVYAIRKTEPDDPIITKSVSFLNTVTYIDWDIVGPTLQTFQQISAKVDQIKSYDKIYFIDRSEIVNGNIKMVPVEAPITY